MNSDELYYEKDSSAISKNL